MEGKGFVLPGRDRVPSVFAAGCLFFCALAGKFAVNFAAGLLRPAFARAGIDTSSNAYTSILAALVYFLFLLLPFMLYARKKPGISEYIRVKPISGLTGFLCALTAITGFLLCVYVNVIWSVILEALGGTLPSSTSFHAGSVGEMLGLVVSVAIMPAVCEEILFRGVMLSAWEEKGSKRALVIVALLFVLSHSSVAGIPIQFICGVILTYAVIVTDSLFAGIIIHTVHNSMALIIGNLSSSAESSQTVFRAIGGWAGVTGLVFIYIPLFGFLTFLLLRRLKRVNRLENFGRPALKGPEKSLLDYTVIICGLTVAILLYVPDLLVLIGVLK